MNARIDVCTLRANLIRIENRTFNIRAKTKLSKWLHLDGNSLLHIPHIKDAREDARN
jgi:hypothetical protein